MKKLFLIASLPLLLLTSCDKKEEPPYVPPTPTLENITLSNIQSSYTVGDSFIKPTVTAHYSDSSETNVTSDTTFSGYDMSVASTYTVTATYLTKSTTFDITVNSKVDPEVTLSYISLSNIVDEYTVGDTFVKPTVTAYYSDSSSKTVTSSTTFTGYNMNVASTYTVTAKYLDKSKTYTITVSEEEEEFDPIELDCGYHQMNLPKNHSNPITVRTTLSADDSSWYNSEIHDSLPNYYRACYGDSTDDGPSGSYFNPKFYSYSESDPKQYPGGLKFDQKNKGFQTAQFTHTGAKLEIRIGITLVKNASGTPTENTDVFRMYYFDKDGALLGQKNYGEGEITVAKAGSYLKYYVSEDYTKDIAYFEFRLINLAYKGRQNYNFGIGYVNIKSWERA